MNDATLMNEVLLRTGQTAKSACHQVTQEVTLLCEDICDITTFAPASQPDILPCIESARLLLRNLEALQQKLDQFPFETLSDIAQDLKIGESYLSRQMQESGVSLSA